MRFFHVCSVGYRRLTILLVLSAVALAENTPPPRISKQTREQIVHAFNAELVYIHTSFPMGKTGLKLKNGTVSPSGAELQQLMALWGPAAKAGDRARISNIVIKGDYIRFEINGGPVKKPKWYQRIEIGGPNASGPIVPSDANANARGSFVLDAYLETVSPQVKEAIKNHHVLVGMNHDMVMYAKGRPPKKVRETANEVEYEEWIYGTPPQDVDFVRFVGDEVVRVETMKVDGQKIVRTEKEVDLGAPTVAKKQEERPANAPTLRRPGEEMPESTPAVNPSSVPPLGAPQPTGPDTNPPPNWDRPS